MATFKQSLRHLWTFKKSLILFFAPLALSPLVFAYPSKAGRCAYVILIMATYWVTEALPMAVTALLPVVLMPWLGVLGSKKICINYLKDTNMLFIGGLIVAVAVERWNLHKRIALRVLLTVGSQPKWLMFGFMSSTAFLSMWISNSATTAMMIPIAQGVLVELEAHIRRREENSTKDLEKEGVKQEETTQLYSNKVTQAHAEAHAESVQDLEEGDVNTGKHVQPFQAGESNNPTEHTIVSDVTGPSSQGEEVTARKMKTLAKGMCLCVAAAANIGGMSTLTGTGTNVVFKGQIDTLYGSEAGINFSSWFAYAFPNVVVSLLLAWVWMVIRFVGPREFVTWRRKSNDLDKVAANTIRREYNKLGPMSFAEIAVLVHFVVLALLWLTREPGFVTGWSHFLTEEGYVTDACVAISICVSLFICPSTKPTLLCCRRRKDGRTPAPAPALLDWPTVSNNMSWGVVFVIGGGFALADSCKNSGLSTAIADFFLRFEGFPVWLLVLLLCTVSAIFTEVTSNVASITLFIPILAELANSLRINPLYLIIPVTLSTSFAFMLPVATPPNAIVFAYGRLKISDMVKSGAVLNVVCILVLQISIHTYGYAFFNLGEFPPWAETGSSVYSNASTEASFPMDPYSQQPADVTTSVI